MPPPLNETLAQCVMWGEGGEEGSVSCGGRGERRGVCHVGGGWWERRGGCLVEGGGGGGG